jgi:S1-C subfamily serine protease
MARHYVTTSLSALVLGLLLSAASAESDLKDSVVKIYTVSQAYDYLQPWQMSRQASGTGSGCIIAGNRILTNAHVVANHTFIQVMRAGQAKKYVARLEIVGHECDLAMLRVDDEAFFEGTKPVDIGELPKIRDKVAVYGFPAGGARLAITEGIVSRVENIFYSHSYAFLLCCQIDAPINPGSSGGPVISDGKIAGIAFQGRQSGENIGYMVPPPVIQHFLDDIADGTYDGTPDLAIEIETMENPDLRSRYRMQPEEAGILVTKVHPESLLEGLLAPEDVILEIGAYDVANDGTVEFRTGERTAGDYAVQAGQMGEATTMRILRGDERLAIDIPLTVPINSWQTVPRQTYEVAPTYFIVGGLVFSPVTSNLIGAMGSSRASGKFLDLYMQDSVEDREQVVTLLQILADETNMGYDFMLYSVIDEANGRKIVNIRDLVEAIETHQGEYHTILDEDGFQITLSTENARQAAQGILARYRIPADRSTDLLGGEVAGE